MLQPHLIRYRGAVRDLASGLNSGALDPTLTSEVDDTYRDQLAPHLEGLYAQLRKSRLARGAVLDVAKDFKSQLKAFGGGLLTTYAFDTRMTELQLQPIRTIATVSGLLAVEVLEVFQRHNEKREAIRDDQWFYLLELEHQLPGGKPRP